MIRSGESPLIVNTLLGVRSGYVYGGSTTGISQVGGDSGSPLYERYTSTMGAAIGIVDTSNGNFTQVADIDSQLNVYIYTTP